MHLSLCLIKSEILSYIYMCVWEREYFKIQTIPLFCKPFTREPFMSFYIFLGFTSIFSWIFVTCKLDIILNFQCQIFTGESFCSFFLVDVFFAKIWLYCCWLCSLHAKHLIAFLYFGLWSICPSWFLFVV